MLIAKIENGAVAKVADYRELFPNTSFPPSGPSADFLADSGCLPVTVFKPHDRNTQKLVSVAPYVEDGVVYTVAVEDKTQADIDAATASEAANVRFARNKRLADCDWTQLADSTADKAAWAVYRQALRDISAQPGFPFNVVWPLDPNTPVETPLAQ